MGRATVDDGLPMCSPGRVTAFVKGNVTAGWRCYSVLNGWIGCSFAGLRFVRKLRRSII